MLVTGNHRREMCDASIFKEGIVVIGQEYPVALEKELPC
jgi:hypothetical protein